MSSKTEGPSFQRTQTIRCFRPQVELLRALSKLGILRPSSEATQTRSEDLLEASALTFPHLLEGG